VLTRLAFSVDRAQNDIVSVAVVLHQSGFPQIQQGRFFETLLYPVGIIPSLFPMNCQPLVFTGLRLLSLRNGVGLMTEEYDPRIGRQTGNFPQAFLHLDRVGTALNLHDLDPAQKRAEGARSPSQDPV
jgi:hypothetical protein